MCETVNRSQPFRINRIQLAGHIFVNICLIPIYLFFALLAVLLALSPLFPARTARANLRTQFASDFFQTFYGTAAVLFHYFLIIIEDFVFWPLGILLIRDNPTAHSMLNAASARAKENSRGLAVLSAHFGNIEVTADALNATLVPLVSEDTPVMALAKPSSFPWATNLLSWYRKLRRIDVIWTNRKDLARAIIQNLRSGRALALLIDQKPSSAGHFQNFFNSPAAFPEGGVEIALRAQVEFVCIASRRLFPGVYTFEASEIRFSDEPLKMQDVIQAYALWLESVIRMSPWQWCWDYRKWSRKPQKSTLKTPAPASDTH
ncbi:hypothetical protein EBU99_05270 [bacterium]|nr:hypothetical protein [bacterium]